jgi:FkbM family methyltransferase
LLWPGIPYREPSVSLENLYMPETDHLSLRIRALAFLMRRMPTQIRKVWWWWDRMYRAIGGGGFEDDEAIAAQWPAELQGPIRSRRFGYWLYLDLRSFAERRTYFTGAGSQQTLEYLFRVLMRPGDQYVDVGANIGVIALMANNLIGPTGRGFAFEPNPEVFARLKQHFELNRVTTIEPIGYALADQESDARLVVRGRVSGSGSLAFDETGAAQTFAVRTTTAKRYVDQLDLARPTIIKIDSEGYEVKVLRGLGDFLDAPELAVLAEVNPTLLQLAGDSHEELGELMAGRGFRPLAFHLRRDRLRTQLEIKAFAGSAIPTEWNWDDLLFVKQESRIYRERIAPLLSSGR